jgi:hypothetical protein
MPRFTNVGPTVHVYRTPEKAGSLLVNAGQIIEVAGALAVEQPADAYQVGEGDDARLWPHAQWSLVEDKPVKAAPATKEN